MSEQSKEAGEAKDGKEEKPNPEPANEKEKIDDIQLSWENLATALQIAENKLKAMSEGECQAEQAEKNKIMDFLSKVYLRMGELENWREGPDALKYLQNALDIRLKFDDQSLSRDLAEIYFTLSNTLSWSKQQEDKVLYYLVQST